MNAGQNLGHTTRSQKLIDFIKTGDLDARNEIIEHTCDRLRLLARRMLRGYPRVKRWAETDDVLQNAMLRLHRSLMHVTPDTPSEFYALATTQIRRELIDLARHFHGKQGLAANHHSDGGDEVLTVKQSDACPATLESWEGFHNQVSLLPDEERAVVDLIWYEGVTQLEASKILGVSLATLKRRWQSARLTLHERLEFGDYGIPDE